MKRAPALATAKIPDFSNFYGDEEDPDPDQINEHNETSEVTRMFAKMESPSRKKMKKVEIERD